MGRKPRPSDNHKMNKGAWTALEDKILNDYVTAHGDKKWSIVAREAGLNRCAKNCRLRWLNYLRPGIKRGNITEDEEELIIRLYNLLGNRWALIAGRLPGRTDNEIKDYWNTIVAKKVKAAGWSTESAKENIIDKRKKSAERSGNTGQNPHCSNEIVPGEAFRLEDHRYSELEHIKYSDHKCLPMISREGELKPGFILFEDDADISGFNLDFDLSRLLDSETGDGFIDQSSQWFLENLLESLNSEFGAGDDCIS